MRKDSCRHRSWPLPVEPEFRFAPIRPDHLDRIRCHHRLTARIPEANFPEMASEKGANNFFGQIKSTLSARNTEPILIF